MQHSFDIKLAEEIGIIPAILFNHIAFWIRKNEANEKHFYDSRYWTYSSVKGFKEYFPYLTENQIRRALETLTEKGLLIKGNYNSNPYDRTSWFTLGDIAKSIWQGGKIELANLPNGNGNKAKPIPDKETDKNTDNNKEKKLVKKEKFVPPTIEEVKAYIAENGYRVNADKFMAHYESNGWLVGRNPMKNWKAAVRYWASDASIGRQPQGTPPKSKPIDYEEGFFNIPYLNKKLWGKEKVDEDEPAF